LYSFLGILNGENLLIVFLLRKFNAGHLPCIYSCAVRSFFVMSGNNTAYLNKWCVGNENLDSSLR